MNLENLKTFMTVAEKASFSAAASHLKLTQPAISKRISQLEMDLEVKLLDRSDRLVTLTPAGKDLLPRARFILAELDKLRTRIKGKQEKLSGSLQLATNHHIGIWKLPHLIRKFSEQYPQVVMDLRFMDSEKAYGQILQRESEIALVTLSPSLSSRYETVKIWSENMVIVCHKSSALSSQRIITLDLLAQSPAVLPDVSTFTGRIIRSLFTTNKLAPTISTSTNYLETLKSLCTMGIGWTMIPDFMIDDSLTRLNVEFELPSRNLGFIYLKHRTLSPTSERFIEMTRRETQF